MSLATVINTNNQRLQDLDDQIGRLTQELDAHVARAKRELSGLKRNRNALSSISQLPTDVLIIIFSMSLRALEMNGQRTTLPDVVQLSHVCHAWREIARNTPSLWTWMQIRASTKPELLRFQLERSKLASLTVDYRCASTDSPNLDLICQIIGDGAQRIRSLTIHGRDLAVQGILKASRSMLRELEALEVYSLEPRFRDGPLRDRAFIPEDVFPSNSPRLRTLRLLDCITTWQSLHVASPSLVSLSMGGHNFESCQVTRQYTTHLVDFLRCSPQLEALGLAFPISAVDNTASEDNMAPVELPNLHALLIRACDTEPFAFILPHLILGPKIQNFYLYALSVRAEDIHSATHEMLSYSQEMCSRLEPPQQVLLAGDGVTKLVGFTLKAWKVPTVSSGPYSDQGPTFEIAPWAWLAVDVHARDSWRRHAMDGFPLATPGDPNLGWWFSSLRSLIVHGTTPTADFWTMISTRTSIQFLSVTLAPSIVDISQAFYRALCGKDTGRDIPFPALRTLQLGGNHILSDIATMASYEDTLDALQRRRGADDDGAPVKHPLDLEEVAFVNFRRIGVGREYLERMLEVADKVAWHARAEDGLSPWHCQVERSETT